MDIRYIQNSVLQIAMAKKKFLLADTIEAVQATSMWFSLIVSARNNRLDAQKYVSAVCSRNNNRRTGLNIAAIFRPIISISQNVKEQDRYYFAH